MNDVSSSARDWVKNRVTVADGLVRSYRHSHIDGERDAQVILCAALSTLSASCWPKASDGRRFVELLVRYSHVQPSVRTISVPVLIDRFPNEAHLKQLDYFDKSQVLDSEEIDVSDRILKANCFNLALNDIRSASYANFIYKYLRCGLLHEYTIKGNLANNAWLHRDRIHYSNSDSEKHPKGRRLLHFPYSYLRELVISSASCLCDKLDNTNASELRLPSPEHWWIDA